MASYDYEIFENHRPQIFSWAKYLYLKSRETCFLDDDWTFGGRVWSCCLDDDWTSLKIRREQRLRRDLEKAITHLESVYRFGESNGHNFDIKSLDPTKMTQEAYIKMNDVIKKLFLRAMITRCFIALKFFMGLMVESSDGKAKIQEIKAKIQDKFNYNGNCNVKIGIIPEGSGTPFLRWVYSGRLQWSKKFILHSWCCV